MADFFGGILDGLKSTGDDLGSLERAMGGGIGGGPFREFGQGQQDAFSYSSSFRGYQDPFKYEPPQHRDQREPAADFNTIEQQWLRRLQRFHDIQTDVK